MNAQENKMGQIVGGDKFDLAKGVLSFMIVVLHSHFLYKLIGPLLHISVPLFFIISSFFFFQKYDNAISGKYEILMKYIKRNILLLFFWTFVFLPVLIQMHTFQFDGCISFIIQFFRLFIFSEFFPASWFITASIFAVLLLIIISKVINQYCVWGICLCSYLICLLSSSYSSLTTFCIEEIPTIINLIGKPHNCFLVALLWINIGRWFANNISKIDDLKFRYTPLYVALIALFAEYALLSMYSSPLAKDCYLSYIFICPAIFILLIKAPSIAHNKAKKIRELSVCTFCTHGTIIFYILNPLAKSVGFQGQFKALCIMILTFFICFSIYHLISIFKVKFHWLKYSI